MTHQSIPRALSRDAEAFLVRSGSSTVFDGAVSPEDAAEFLNGERSRLGTRVGAGALDARAQAVTGTDHRLSQHVAVRAYQPPDGDATKPVILYIHGGGWVSGSIEQHDSTCRILAVEADAVVFNVDYRLAPEHVYPAALDDCEAVLNWILAGAGDNHAMDTSRIAVCGSSSGGNLAAALAMRAARRQIGLIAAQVLIYPALDSRMSGESHRLNGSGYFVSVGQMAWYWDSYRGGIAATGDPEFSPLAAEDLSRLPPAIIVTAEFDLLRDDGARFAERLAADGVPVRRIHYPGQIHGFMGLLDDINEAYPAVTGLGKSIGDALRVGITSRVWPRGQMV